MSKSKTAAQLTYELLRDVAALLPVAGRLSSYDLDNLQDRVIVFRDRFKKIAEAESQAPIRGSRREN